MKPDKLLLELEHILEQAGYTLRKERGSFRGDECVVLGNKIVMVNKSKPAEIQIGTIARILRQIPLDDIFIKPAVRKELAVVWERIEAIPMIEGLENLEEE